MKEDKEDRFGRIGRYFITCGESCSVPLYSNYPKSLKKREDLKFSEMVRITHLEQNRLQTKLKGN